MEWNFDDEKDDFKTEGWSLSSKLGSIKCQITESTAPVSFNLKGEGVATIMNYSESTFLVVKEKGGISLTFNGEEKYHKYTDKAEFADGIYTSNCFYFYDKGGGNGAIFRKTVDKNHLKFCIEINGSEVNGRTIRNVVNNENLIILNNDGKRLKVYKIDDISKEIEEKETLDIEDKNGDYLIDFRTFRTKNDGDGVVTLTKDGYLIAFNFGFQNKILEKKAEIKIPLSKDEEAISMAISNNSELVAVSTKSKESNLSYKMYMFEYSGEKVFKKIAEYDLRPNCFEQFNAFEFHKDYKEIENVVFCAATYTEINSGKILHFTFDRKRNVISELVNLRRNVISKKLSKFSNFDKHNKAVIGDSGKLVLLKYD